MSFAEASNILWRERQLLELLLFKLDEEQLVLAAGRSRWLTHATREVEMVLEQIREAELTRAIAIAELGTQLNIGAEPSLRQIIDTIESPWNTIFEDHRQAFIAATQEIQNLASLNKELLATGYQATRDALTWIAESVGPEEVRTYSASGQAKASEPGRTGLLNQAI